MGPLGPGNLNETHYSVIREAPMSTSHANDQKTLREAFPQLNKASVDAFNLGDSERCANFYDENATLFVQDEDVIEGRANIAVYLRHLYDTGTRMEPVRPLVIESKNELGFCAGTFRVGLPAQFDAGECADGKFITVFKRIESGDWVAIIDSFFVDTVRDGLTAGASMTERTGRGSATEQDEARSVVRGIYQRGARYYDWFASLYYVAGMRVGHWRRTAIGMLALQPGDTVVEIGCGTGLNFALLEESVGPQGRIIGVDISEAMLERAAIRVRKAAWQNVELVHGSASEFEFPDNTGGILATGVLNYEPEYDRVIMRGADALLPGRRWVVLDYREPTTWLRYLTPAFVLLGRTFGVSRRLMRRRPWESVERYLRNCQIVEMYGGFVYIIAGESE